MQHKTGIRLAAGALLVAALVASAALLEAESHGVFRSSQWAHSPDNLLRLHVLAHSDAPEDQAAKLAVRDAVLREMASWQLPEDRVQMERWVKERESRLLDAARRALAEREDPHEVRVEVGTFAFAETSWRGGSLPAGQYRAVRVVIGDGAGQNWWCVLFPPLCFAETGDDEGAPPLGGPSPRRSPPTATRCRRPPARRARTGKAAWCGRSASGRSSASPLPWTG